jgi:hypothetical protein
MAKKDGNFDKNFLIISALLAVGGAVGLYSMKGAVAEKLVSPKSTPGTQFPQVPVKEASNAQALLLKSFQWTQPSLANKPVPLNKSVTVIMKNGELFDIYNKEPALRDGMSNEFLLKYGLDYLSPNVGEMDPDNDGFSNEEESKLNTSPIDAKSVPGPENKLFFVNRVQDDYILLLSNGILPAQVKRVRPEPKSVFVDAMPKTFGFDAASQSRFEAKSFELKRVGELDMGHLTVLDNATGETFVLIQKQEKNLAEYQAELEFRLKEVTKLRVKKGETFYLPKVGTKYILQNVTETEATVAPIGSDGKPGVPFTVKPR